MSCIRFEKVSKSYPSYHQTLTGFKAALLNPARTYRAFKGSRRTVLHDISFEVRRGESVGLIGSNGSGKSTTMALIAGVLKPDSGAVSVSGRIAPLLELGAGFHPDLTGRENVILNGILLGLTRREIDERFDSVVAFSELGEYLDQPLRTYSSGMNARLGFAVAVHLDPEILLIDEILAVGDIGFRAKCHERMREFKRRGVSVILVSHHTSEVAAFCDRVIWLNKGRIAAEGDPESVLPQYERFQVGNSEIPSVASAPRLSIP